MVHITDLANGGVTGREDATQLARGQPQQRIAFLSCQHPSAGPCTPHQLPAPADLELHVVNRRAGRNGIEWQGVPGLDLRVGPRDKDIILDEALGSNDIALLSISVEEESNTGRAVRVILDTRHPGRNARLVPFEVNDAVGALHTPASMPDRDSAGYVATGLALVRAQ
jgi:hypothetical protein